MRFYLLMKLTGQGASDVVHLQANLEEVATACRNLGGQVHATDLTVGKYDCVLLGELGSLDEATSLALIVTERGLFHTELLPAKPITEFRDLWTAVERGRIFSSPE